MFFSPNGMFGPCGNKLDWAACRRDKVFSSWMPSGCTVVSHRLLPLSDQNPLLQAGAMADVRSDVATMFENVLHTRTLSLEALKLIGVELKQ